MICVLLAFACLPARAQILATDHATVTAVRFGGDDALTRVVIDLDQKPATRLIPSDDQPSRLIVSMLGATLTHPLEGASHGRVRAWSLVAVPGGVRLNLELAPAAVVQRRFLIAPMDGGQVWRYVVDLAGSGTLAQAAHVAPKTHWVSKVVVARKVVVIDAGHGGHDPGAHGADNNEKDVTLAAARTLRAKLELSGRYRVVMTRNDDTYIPLEQRVQIARRAGADLFISLHADSAGDNSQPHGASVYTISDHGETRVHSVVGPTEWFTRTGSKARDPRVSQILLDLTQRSTRNRSSVFAALLVERISDRVDLLPHTRRDASYFVLLAPDVPAVLLEMGFISNPKDEARLIDPAQRARLVEGVAGAIDAYFAGPTRIVMN